MRLILSLLLGSVLVVGAAGPAAAQLGRGSVEVQPFVGVLSFDDDLFLDSTLGFGARLGYNFTDTWALEGSFNYVPKADQDFGDLGGGDIFPEVTTMLAHANLNYNFLLNNSQLVPFLTAGGGIANFNVDNDDAIDEDSETDGEVNFGGGLKLFISETVAIRGDVRDHIIFATIPNEDPDESEDVADAKSTQNLEFSGGVTFNF